MKVSIITATYNSAKTVRDTLVSVRDQTYDNIEHLIVDGVSSDNTLTIVGEFPHVATIDSRKDKGLYDAMNRGVKLASGDIVAILNSDDVYANTQVVEKMVDKIRNEKSLTAYADLNYVKEDNLEDVVRSWKSGSFSRKQFLMGWMPPHPTFFVHKKVYQDFGHFRLDMGSAADYEIMLRFLYKHEVSVAYLPEVIVKMREGGVSNASIQQRWSANQMDRKAWEVNELQPRWYTRYAKPLRKLSQWM